MSAAEQIKSAVTIEDAFIALWNFCRCEMEWECFRAERFHFDKPESASAQNAQKLIDFLESAKAVPVVQHALKSRG